MKRIRLGIAWLLLLLILPAAATAQRANPNRSRDRSESNRVVTVDRAVKRTADAKTRNKSKKEKARVRENKSSDRGTNDVKKSMRRDARNAGNRSERKKSVRRSDDRPAKVNRNRSKDHKRKGVVKRNQERRGSVRQGPAKHKTVRHKPVRPVVKKRHRISHVNKRYVRYPAKRYVYRHRRYHRRHIHGVSIGFFIRVPFVRWHVGHTRRFVYRQVISRHPAGAVEVVSTFKRKIRHVKHDYVEVEFELDELQVHSGGRFVGEVEHFPGSLRKMRAKIYRDGFVQFDRMLYVVGNNFDGFELLSTRYCGGDLGQASYQCLDTRAGELDFYRARVNATRYSRLIDQVHYGRAVPVALFPDEEYAGFQFVVGYSSGSDSYYSGSFDYSTLSRFDSDGTAFRLSNAEIDGFSVENNANFQEAPMDGSSAFAHQSVLTYGGAGGQTFELQREAEIRYADD